MNLQRLSPEAFKQIAIGKGWSLANLAFIWNRSASWLSVLIHDRQREIHWDHSVRGLPVLSKIEAKEITQARLKQKHQNQLKRRPAAAALESTEKRTPGFRYHGYLVRGSVVVTVDEIFDLPEGTRGAVLQTRVKDAVEEYLIDVEGNQDWFPPDYVDRYFVSTGEMVSL